MIVVSSKSQDTMIAIACKAFFLYRGHKRARTARRPRFIRWMPWQNVKNVSDLDENVRNVREPIRTE